jgi:predicted transcriptional regulator
LNLEEICKLLKCEVLVGEDLNEVEAQGICAADLMSDVLAFTKPGSVLLTGLSNVQSVITTHVAEVVGVIYVRGKKPDAEAVKLAGQKGIPLLASPLSMYEACGRLWSKGVKIGSDLGGE